MKIDFSRVIFTDESRVTFNRPDKRAKGSILSNLDMSVAKRKQGNSSVVICAVVVDQTIIGPFKVDEGVKLNAANYCNLMDKTFFEWYKSKFLSFKVKCVFMHINASSHISKITREFFEHKRFTGEKTIIYYWSESYRKSIVNREDNIIWRWKTI